MTAEVLVLIVAVVFVVFVVYVLAVARGGGDRESAEPGPIPPDERRRGETGARLESATNVWTKPVVMRRYASNERGTAVFEREAEILLARGYRIESRDAEGGHLHAVRLLLTGGLSILGGRGGIRSRGMLVVTFRKADTDPQDRRGPPPARRRSAPPPR